MTAEKSGAGEGQGGILASYRECERLVGEADPDRAVSVLFAPPDKRRHLRALYAFNVEVARVRDQVSQPLPGEIRLRWWRDLIAAAALGEGGQGHPVADALTDTIRACALPAAVFDRFIEARIFDLYDDPMPDRTAFEAYAGETASSLIMLAATILDREAASAAADAAGHAGVAQLAVGVIRLLPLHRARGQTFLPADLLAAVGCDAAALSAGDEDATGRAVAAMAAFAREHVRRYEALRPKIGAGIRAAFLPADLTGAHLDRIERQGASAMKALAGPDARRGLWPLRRSWLYWRSMRA